MNANTLWLGMGWTMLHFLWIGTVIGLSGAMVMHAMRRVTSEARYGTSLLTLFLLVLAPPIIAWRLATNASPAIPDQSVSAFTPSLEIVPTPGAGHMPRFAMLLPDRGSTGDSQKAGSSIFKVSIPAHHSRSQVLNLAAVWLPWVWVAGSPLTFLWLACGLLGAERLRRQSRRLGERSCTETCARLCQTMRITRPVDLAVCDRLVTPVLVGVVRPLILLPAAAMTGWSAEQVEMVLLHELAHVRRWDNLVNLIQRLVESVLFFHPIVWIVSGWVRKEREHCCDGIVVRQTGKASAYVETLLTLSTTAAGPVPQIAVAMARGHLVARVRHILELGADRHPMKLPRGLLVLTGTLLIMPVGLVLSRAQQVGLKPTAEARTGRVDPADLVTQALGLVEAVVPVRGAEGWTIHPIVDIAGARARMGDSAGSATAFEEALKRARAIASPGLRANEIREVALGLARAGEAEKSLELAMEQEENVEGFDLIFRSHLLSEIATDLARSGKLELASRTVERVSDSSARNDALAEIALAQARQSGLASALQSVDKIDDPGMRVRALAGPFWDGAGIAWIRDSAGDKKGAGLAFNKAISIVSTMPEGEETDYATASLAIARARLGDVSSGLEQAKGCKEERARSIAQGAIAQILAANGDWDAASQTANAVADPALKARAFCQIGNAQTRAGKREAAVETLQKALDANSKHNGIEDYSIAIGLARAGDIKAALAIVDAMAARDRSPNPILLADLAVIEAQAGDFRAARAIAGMIADPGAAGIAWEKIARAQADTGHEAEALQWAEALEDPLRRSRALLGVAEGLAARRKRESQQKP
jgi:beta-lactamase regulating signal transducer with metallopeptidase domain/tetratricopeptide (TPR) repeat protein